VNGLCGGLRHASLRFRLDVVQEFARPGRRHPREGGHDHAPRLLLELARIGVAAVNHGLGVLEKSGQPGAVLALGDVLEVGTDQAPPADGVAAGAVLLEVVGGLLRDCGSG